MQRPNAVTQLQVLGERANVAVYAPEPGNGVGDPVEVARSSIDYARRNNYNVVIIDTAGRLGIDEEMMQQAADIRDAVSPDEILFVVDAMIGQDAVTTAQAFLEGVGYDAVALTKLDGDARGGAALSIRHLTGRPIMFASTGEKLEDFDLFHPDRMASRILDMGDVLTLIEQAQRTFEEEEVAKMASTLASDEDFTLEDFLEQMMMIRKLGPIGKLLQMMPGMGQMREQIENIDERELDRVAAIIRSMTPEERANPKIINGSRRLRIAKGSEPRSATSAAWSRASSKRRRCSASSSRAGSPACPGCPASPACPAWGPAGRRRPRQRGRRARRTSSAAATR